MVDGRQYIIVAVGGGAGAAGGGPVPSQYVAFALPAAEIRPATQQQQ